MAIMHLSVKSSSTAPPARGHAEYITGSEKYERKQGVEHVEHGNMPRFAEAEPLSFWSAADEQERANGRAYTEVQFALPRELDREKQVQLARQATAEFVGDRHAYTLAVHIPNGSDGKEQPHAHLMFSERRIDENTRELPEERFFKRNGATKDRAWNDKTKPEELRETWCTMMNRAMLENNVEIQVDHRSYERQGRQGMVAFREPKIGYGPGAKERVEEVVQLRVEKAELVSPEFLQQTPSDVESHAEKQIESVEQRAQEELKLIDRAIAEIREKYQQVSQYVREKIDSWHGEGSASAAETKVESPPTGGGTFLKKFRRERAGQIEERQQKQEQKTHKPRHTQ